jgi:hypothetical protein
MHVIGLKWFVVMEYKKEKAAGGVEVHTLSE